MIDCLRSVKKQMAQFDLNPVVATATQVLNQPRRKVSSVLVSGVLFIAVRGHHKLWPLFRQDRLD